MSTITLTLIQSNLQWENKEFNLQKLREKILAIKEKTEIVVLPEMFSTGFCMKPEEMAETMDGNTVNWMKGVAAEKKVIVTGSIIIGETLSTGETAYFNRLVWMLPNGQFGFYDKRH